MTHHKPDALVYVDQSASALCLNAVYGDLDTDQFSIFRQGSLAEPDGNTQVKAGIIGGSHFVSVSKGDAVLHEVFACVEVFTTGTRAYCGNLESIKSGISWELHGRVVYRFRAEKVHGSQAIIRLAALERDVELVQARTDSGIGLMFQFPSSEEGEFPPKTVLTVQKGERRNSFLVTTAHAYPNDDVVVFTQSEMALEDDLNYEN